MTILERTTATVEAALEQLQVRPAPPPKGSGLRQVPGVRSLPLVGESLHYMKDPLGWCEQRYASHGPVSMANLFGKPMVVLLGPEAYDVVLTNRDKAFSNHGGWDYGIGEFFHRGVMLMDFEEHHHHRRIMQAAFTRDRLVTYLAGMQPVIDDSMGAWQPGESFLLSPALKQLTLDIASRTFTGQPVGEEADRLNRAFNDCVRATTAVVRHDLPLTRWSRGVRGRRLLEAAMYAQLPAKKAVETDDLFSVLCHARTDDGMQFTDEDVVNHMIFLLMAAHDTSTTSMNTMAYYLAKHPEWQERCRAESLALGKDTLDYDDLDALPSLDLVFKECLRLITPVPQMPRGTVKDTEVLGHFIPAGTYVAVVPQFTHRMAEYWPHPERFDPERFSADRREDKVHKCAWVPFGQGVHKCIGMFFGGMEVKATMHQMLLRYEWSVPDGYELPWDRTSLPVPGDGLPVSLTRRSLD